MIRRSTALFISLTVLGLCLGIVSYLFSEQPYLDCEDYADADDYQDDDMFWEYTEECKLEECVAEETDSTYDTADEYPAQNDEEVTDNF